MGVQIEPLINGERKAVRKPAYTGLIPSSAVESALIWMIRLSGVMLIVLSIFGTFYGLLGRDAPLATPWLMPGVAVSNGSLFLAALLVQVVLGLTQWGARLLAARDLRWWIAYIASLSLSIYYNWSSYGDPLLAMQVPIVVAFGIVAAGDVVAELALLKE